MSQGSEGRAGREASGPADVGRSRAGNAMARTRGAVLAGARTCVLTTGTRRTTMVDVAATSGVAKATLYNHFRTKSEVLAALVDSEVAAALADARELAATAGLVTALVRLAERAGEHPVVRRLAETEPGVLQALVLPGATPAPTWERVRTGLAELLGDRTQAAEPLLRFLVSQLLWPSSREEATYAVGLLVGGAPADGDAAGAVPAAPAVPAAVPEPVAVAPEPVDERQTVPGLGFPAPAVLVGGSLERIAVPASI